MVPTANVKAPCMALQIWSVPLRIQGRTTLVQVYTTPYPLCVQHDMHRQSE